MIPAELEHPALEQTPHFIQWVEALRKQTRTGEWRRYVRQSPEILNWRYFLSHDPYTRWGLLKPRGFAGDARVMDFAYRHRVVEPLVRHSGDLGEALYRQTSGSVQSESARLRIQLIAEELEAFCTGERQARIASYACGHGRELELLSSSCRSNIELFCGIDTDQFALKDILDSIGDIPHQLVNRNVFRYSPLDGEGFDFVYSLGLFDYLTMKQSRFLCQRMAEAVQPGGKLLIANLDPDAANLGYCEAIMDWWMIPKSKNDFEELASLLGDDFESVQITRSGCFNYLVCKKLLHKSNTLQATT
ncbi:MAG: class I SAM-dependent methyltransferase [Verrucomicrobia bacterium]|nr:class I SAM-dependent methyltransferase [Verrucomicrobiota bacterium]MCH8512833.1 class I SAM-dependent methyltransferase [Kiritimatiellia bacterium]